MAQQTLGGAALPDPAALQSFARAAAQLLVDRRPRAPGARSAALRAGAGIQHFDHRDYVPGDEVRHIDWRLTARARHPVVRRFEAESVSNWTLLVDASSSMAAHGGAKWQAAVQLAAAMAYALLHVGHRVGLLVFGARVLAQCPRGRGQQHYAAIARQLVALRPAQHGERSDPGVCIHQLHGAASVFVISDFMADDEMRRDLGALRQRCVALHLVQATDATETALQALGEIDLVDVETGARLHADIGHQANTLAASERAAMTARLARFCARSGVAWTDWDISRPWQPTLLAHLQRARC